MAKPGILCLEGEWDSDLRARASVEPILHLLERLGRITSIHRDVSTIAEVEHVVRTWAQHKYDAYPVLYIAAHGSRNTVSWSTRQTSSLDELAEMLRPVPGSFYVYFGSCQTLADDQAVRRFAAVSGARAVVGYRRDIDWIESAAFDVVLLSELAEHSGYGKGLFSRLMRNHGQTAKRLHLVVGTKNAILRAEDQT